MLFRSFYLIHEYKIKGINLYDHLNFISPYWFLSWFIYGWGYWIGAMFLFGVITLSLTLIFNLINNLVLRNCKVKKFKTIKSK